MTGKETIEILQELWRYKETDKYTESEIRLALDIAIQTLKNQPRFIMRSCGRIERIEPWGDVLDKIRTEVADAHLIGYATINGKRAIASKAVFDIIDKYKAESEAAEQT